MSDESSNLATKLPPLRLYHFFTWIAVTALWLGPSAIGNDEIATWWIVTALPQILGTTLVVTCCGFGICWRRRGRAFPAEPGHWMLVVACFALLFSMLHAILMALFTYGDVNSVQFREPVSLTSWYYQWGWSASAAPVILLNLWIARRRATERTWMWFFLLSGIFGALHVFYGPVVVPLLSRAVDPLSPAATSVYRVVQFLASANQILPTVVLCWAMWREYDSGIKRHWSHWCGIFAWFATLPSAIALACVNMGWIAYPWE